MSELYPYPTKITRVYHDQILPNGIVIEYTDLLYYSLASCLLASQAFLEQANAFESDRCFDIMQSLMMIDPGDEYTMLMELKAHGFHVALPIDCLFVEASTPHESPEGDLV